MKLSSKILYGSGGPIEHNVFLGNCTICRFAMIALNLLLLWSNTESASCSSSNSIYGELRAATCSESPSDSTEIYDLKFNYDGNLFFIGSEGASNVILGEIYQNLSLKWQKIYPGNKMYSFEMDSSQSSIYFMLVHSNVQYLVQLNSDNGNVAKSISNSENSQICIGIGCKFVITNDNKMYASGTGFVLNTDTSLSFLKRYSISNINSVDQLIYFNDNSYYISSDMSSYYFLMMIDLQNQQFKWGYNVTSSSTSNQLQPAINLEDCLFVLLNVNNAAVFATLNLTDGTISSVYQFAESCVWVSFIKFSTSYVVIGFQDSSKSYLKLNDFGNNFINYEFQSPIKLYGFSMSAVYSSACVFGGSKNSNSYVIETPILAIASHQDIMLNFTTSMATISTTMFSSSTSTPIINSQYDVKASASLPNTITTVTTTCSSNYKSDTSYWLDDIVQTNVACNSSLSISTTFSCIMTGTSIVSVQFSTDGNGNPVPSWGTIDLTNNLLNFSVPYVSSDTTYSFTLVVTSNETHTYTYNVGVNLKVQSCKVSNCMICTSSDDRKCATCNSGYTLNANACTLQTSSTVSQTSSNTSPSTTKTTQTPNTASTTSTASSAAGTASIIAAAVGVVAAAVSSILTISSPQSMWNILNQFQTLVFLLLTQAYFPPETTGGFLILSQYTSFSFDFIPYPSLSFVNVVTNFFNLPIDGDLMSKVGLKSGSTFLNNISLFINILIAMLLHLTFLAVRRILNARWSNRPWVKSVIDKIYRLFTLCLYLRLMMEAYQFLLICSTDEIHSFKTSTSSEIASLAIAILVFIICIIFVILVFVLTIKQIYKSTGENLEKSPSYFDEIFDGTKDTKYSKYYSFMFIMRKALIIMFMLFLPNINIIIKIGFFVLIQSLYYLYLVSVRPLEKAKDNLIGVINETLILMLVNMLFKYNKEPDWTTSSKMVFLMSISVANLIISIICIIDFIITLIKLCIKLKNKVKSKPSRSNNYVEDIKNKERKVANNDVSAVSKNILNKERVIDCSKNTTLEKLNNSRVVENHSFTHSQSHLRKESYDGKMMTNKSATVTFIGSFSKRQPVVKNNFDFE